MTEQRDGEWGGWGDANPYAPADGPPPTWGGGFDGRPPKRPWYKAPGQLIGASTFSAVFTWVAFVCAAMANQALASLERVDVFTHLILVFSLGFVWLVGMAALFLAGAGAVATVGLAVVWFRDPDRSPGAGLALLHAVVAWSFLGMALIWLFG